MLSVSLRARAFACVVGGSILLPACAQRDASGAVVDSGVSPVSTNGSDAGDAGASPPVLDASGTHVDAGGGDSATSDLCPSDPDKTAPGTCGCGVADIDSDGDETPDCNDGCKDDPSKTLPGQCGCQMSESSCGNLTKCATAEEGGSASLSCPNGSTIHAVDFASYGTPSGSCEAGFSMSACHASSSLQKVQSTCVGKQSCSVAASNGVFGDPCTGVSKRFAVKYTCDVGAVKVMPVFLMAGQSNMVGNVDATLFDALLAELATGDASTTQSRLKGRLADWYINNNDGYAAYGYSDAMATFESTELIRLKKAGLVGLFLKTPLSSVMCAMNDAANAGLTTNCGSLFGPELVLGHYLQAQGDTPTSLIKVAKGGTTLFTDWRSPKTVMQSGGSVGPLYAQLQSRIDSLTSSPASVHANCASMPCRWGGFIWFQGENDSMDEAAASAYAKNLTNLLADVRARVGTSTLPVVIVEIGKWAQSLTYGATVRAAQQAVVAADANSRIVKTDDLSGFYHYDPAAQLIIGERVGIALSSLLP